MAPELLHVAASACVHLRHSINYSAQALAINTLLDTLIRPNGDVNPSARTCVEWRHDASKAISHIVLGNAPQPGGQWADNPVRASRDIGALSYSEQLSLPGYSFAQHWQCAKGEALPDFSRPTRAEIADYLEYYPTAVGIDGNIRSSTNVTSITRTPYGFHILPLNIHCRSLVLASGIFSIRLPPPTFLSPLVSLRQDTPRGAILVIGSGFTAADIIISAPANRKIIHLFNWDPVNRPSPLKACHGSAYPEYAWVYRQMRHAAEKMPFSGDGAARVPARKQPQKTPSSATQSFSQRDWTNQYEGFANARIVAMAGDGFSDQAASPDEEVYPSRAPLHPQSAESATVHIGRSSFGHRISREIASFHYAVGRRSTLSYLDAPLRAEVLQPAANPHDDDAAVTAAAAEAAQPRAHDFVAAPSLISGTSLRSKIEDQAAAPGSKAAGLELAPGVFAIGSLTGDSLIRFAYGGCCAVAGAIEDAGAKRADAHAAGRNAAMLDEWRKLEHDWWVWA